MKYFATYDAAGIIMQVGRAEDPVYIGMASSPDAYPGVSFIELEQQADDGFLLSHYVQDGEIKTRSQMAPLVQVDTVVADGETGVTITGLPIPCDVVVHGPHPTSGLERVTDSEITLTFDTPGDYTVKVSAPPKWFDWSTVIHAT